MMRSRLLLAWRLLALQFTLDRLLVLLQSFLDRFLVAFVHLVIFLGHVAADVLLVMSHLSDYVEERWDLELFLLLGRFDSEERRLVVHVEERLDQVVLLVVDEALPALLQDTLRLILVLLDHLNVLASRNLSLLLDSTACMIGPRIMAVGKRVILSSLAEEVLVSFIAALQEYFFDVEDLDFDALGILDLQLARDPKQELLVEGGWSWNANVFAHRFHALVNLFVESPLLVPDDREVGMAHPGVDKLLI